MKRYANIARRSVSLMLAASMLSVICCSCAGNDSPAMSTEAVQSAETTAPEINVTVIGEETAVTAEIAEISEQIDDGVVDDIYAVVCSSVEQRLASVGFETDTGVAYTTENDNYSALGIYYYTNELEFFSDNSVKSVGFVEVSKSTDKFYDASAEEGVIAVNDTDNSDDQVSLICTYNYEDIGSTHFIYQNKYITYYQQTPMRVVYSEYDNKIENYDFSLGSIYDYDNKEFIYDASLLDEYHTHSAIELFSKEDYEKLEAELRKISEEQEKNGYMVNEYNIVYISPENIRAYLDSEEDDTFFGYSVKELTEAFGVGTALEYTADGFKEAKFDDADAVSWKSVLTKVGIGGGLLIVGAALTPLTGGASFGCALVTAVKTAIAPTICAGLSSLAINTIKNMNEGSTLKNAVISSRGAVANDLAGSFMVLGGLSMIGVASGVIKPLACFAEGTPVAVEINNGVIEYRPIESIKIGDKVISYNEETGEISAQPVSKVFAHETNELVMLFIGDETVVTTPEHPFYDPDSACWITASHLTAGDKLLGADGTVKTVSRALSAYSEEAVRVYNFTVENNHTYFVGSECVLVHNECTSIASMRTKAVRDAWKIERKAVADGVSKYNWTRAQKKELLTTGKIAGIDGHHIIPVNELVGTLNENLISSPNNIVFMDKNVHMQVHRNGDSFEATRDVLVEAVPFVAKRFTELNIAA